MSRIIPDIGVSLKKDNVKDFTINELIEDLKLNADELDNTALILNKIKKQYINNDEKIELFAEIYESFLTNMLTYVNKFKYLMMTKYNEMSFQDLIQTEKKYITKKKLQL